MLMQRRYWIGRWGFRHVPPTKILFFHNTTYLWNKATRAYGVTHAHGHVVRILSSPDKELVSHIVGPVIDHETATLDPT